MAPLGSLRALGTEARLFCFFRTDCQHLTDKILSFAFSVSFFQARHYALNRALTIRLLIRQQLQRVDQIVTSCTTCVLLCDLHSYLPPHNAHHQLQCFFFPLSPCVDTHQNVVLQRKTVAMRANIRQGDTSQSTDRRDDRKSVLFLNISCTVPKRPNSYFATFS